MVTITATILTVAICSQIAGNVTCISQEELQITREGNLITITAK